MPGWNHYSESLLVCGDCKVASFHTERPPSHCPVCLILERIKGIVPNMPDGSTRVEIVEPIGEFEPADLRECSNDPPCGSPRCSACELQRVDRRLWLLLHAAKGVCGRFKVGMIGGSEHPREHKLLECLDARVREVESQTKPSS